MYMYMYVYIYMSVCIHKRLYICAWMIIHEWLFQAMNQQRWRVKRFKPGLLLCQSISEINQSCSEPLATFGGSIGCIWRYDVPSPPQWLSYAYSLFGQKKSTWCLLVLKRGPTNSPATCRELTSHRDSKPIFKIIYRSCSLIFHRWSKANNFQMCPFTSFQSCHFGENGGACLLYHLSSFTCC